MKSTPEPTSQATSPEVLDARALAQLRALDPSGTHRIVERVLRTYETSLRQTLSALQAASLGDAGTLDTVRRLAHTLRSSSASVGALALSAHCATVERLAREGQADTLPGALEALCREGLLIQEALPRYLTAEPHAGP